MSDKTEVKKKKPRKKLISPRDRIEKAEIWNEDKTEMIMEVRLRAVEAIHYDALGPVRAEVVMTDEQIEEAEIDPYDMVCISRLPSPLRDKRITKKKDEKKEGKR